MRYWLPIGDLLLAENIRFTLSCRWCSSIIQSMFYSKRCFSWCACLWSRQQYIRAMHCARLWRCWILCNNGRLEFTARRSDRLVYILCWLCDDDTECTISHCKKQGLVTLQKSQCTLRRCEISENGTVNPAHGVEIKTESHPTFYDCKIHSNSGLGLNVQDKGRGWLERTRVYNNAKGNIIVGQSSYTEMIDVIQAPSVDDWFVYSFIYWLNHHTNNSSMQRCRESNSWYWWEALSNWVSKVTDVKMSK